MLLAGEPGIGKSRLVMELEECLGAEPHASLRYFSSPNDADSAFHPIIMQLERATRLQRHDAAECQPRPIAGNASACAGS